MNKAFKCPRPVIKLNKKGKPIGEKWVGGVLVTFPVSYTYNGGTIIDNEFYTGYEVPAPEIPKGYKLRSIGIGFQLNARPPYATQLLEKIP